MQPKLQSCVPFTPVTGSRVLVRDTALRDALTKVAAQTLTKITGTLAAMDSAATLEQWLSPYFPLDALVSDRWSCICA